MKIKIYSLLLIGFLMFSSMAFASPVSRVILPTTVLDDSTTFATSDSLKTDENNFNAFFVHYDETEVGASVSATVTVDFSQDNDTFISGSFYDLAGGPVTLQTSETLSSDGTYYFWIEDESVIPYVRVSITGISTDADDTITTKVTARGRR